MAAAWVMLLALQACGQGPEPDPTPGATDTDSPSPSPDSTALGQECFSPRDGYQVQYPQDWHVNDPEGADPCAWFHPDPFTLPVATEAPDIAIRISVEDLGYQQMSDAITSGPNVKQVVSTEQIEVAGRRALRVEVVESGEVFYPEDTRQTIFAVEWEEAALTASTTSVAEGDYTAHVEVLDAMVQTLEPYDSEVTCSAAVLDPDAPDQQGLPEEVAATRAAIVEAAVVCDYEGLAELAQQGDQDFTFSFGGGDDPAEHWRDQEAEELGPDPMRYLAGLLKRPYESREVEGTTQYLWPAAFAYESWDAVPEEQKEALRPLYNEVNFNDFARFGGYLGYRVGIDEGGNWLFFVAGD